MFHQKLSITCLSLAITTLTPFGVIVPRVEASPTQTQQISTKASDWFFQGLIKVNQQDYQGAISDFTQAIQLNPQYAEAYYQRGLIYKKYVTGKPLNPDGTLPGCQRNNDIFIVCSVEMTSNKKQETREKAIADFTQAIQINPKYAAAYHQRGLIQENQQKKLQDFQVAIDLYLQKSLVDLNQNNYQEAAKLLENVDKLHAERESLTRVSLAEKKKSDNPIGSSTDSPNRKSPEELMDEARQALRKADLQTAQEKYRHAARIFQERKENKRYQEVQQIITGLERQSNGYSRR
ncbi:tetratricopeptide repeat protein [Iningainema tapete]|uniref:Tetratricopeptide repeat protein n=1 Tax=Iningainema tapete BLCC-T55 TaxID=2748662 RepID=A0A8J6XII3_9CYAN|nr:tetratricopeptide repeat protein [Iningainema tapete]MBD2777455.1 tetratricopeptide repeat protein [Iningainema tapete BLCC-T55]